ncbi:MAG: hypothetical protein AB7O52_11610 [Planctomycetota bacterium]
MRTWVLVGVFSVMMSGLLSAQIDVRSNGQDGVFAPQLSDGVQNGSEWILTIDLRNAYEGTWNDLLSPAEIALGSPVYGRGIYDPARWAVVFHYQSVNIPAGMRVVFTNHRTRAPVVWLVQGDVTIAGVVDLNGNNFDWAPTREFTEAGPGGFRGGAKTVGTLINTGGLGPGGGGVILGGSFATGPRVYGNPSLIPLVGGSGGGGGLRNGASGGGAILIASNQVLTLAGAIRCNGGIGAHEQGFGGQTGSGAGGGIRLIAATLAGSGSTSAVGGTGFVLGGLGRIRLEYLTLGAGNMSVQPNPSVVAAAPAPQLWLIGDDGLAATPQARIFSVGGEVTPTDPSAQFGAPGADVVIPEPLSGETTVIVETLNVETVPETEVRVVANYGNGGNLVDVPATYDPGMDAGPFRYWVTSIPVGHGYVAIQARVSRP